MKSDKTQKTQHLSSEYLPVLSKHVFSLKKEEEIILKKLVEKPLNKFQVYQKTKNYARVRLGRAAVENWLNESKTRNNLLELEFVTRKGIGQTRAGKQEYRYFLTTKGFLAVIGYVQNPERVYLLGNYLKLLKKRINDDFLFTIAKNYIMSQIEIFLAWHYVHNINLHDMKQSRSYFQRFFETIYIGFLEFPKLPKEKYEYVVPILENQYKHYKIMHFIDEAANPKNQHIELVSGFNKKLNNDVFSKLQFLYLEIQRWFSSLEIYQETNWKVQSHVIPTEKYAQIDIVKANEEIKKMLQSIGYESEFIDSLLHLLESTKLKFSSADEQRNTEQVFQH